MKLQKERNRKRKRQEIRNVNAMCGITFAGHVSSNVLKTLALILSRSASIPSICDDPLRWRTPNVLEYWRLRKKGKEVENKQGQQHHQVAYPMPMQQAMGAMPRPRGEEKGRTRGVHGGHRSLQGLCPMYAAVTYFCVSPWPSMVHLESNEAAQKDQHPTWEEWTNLHRIPIKDAEAQLAND